VKPAFVNTSLKPFDCHWRLLSYEFAEAFYVYNGKRYRRTLATPNPFSCNQITANKICLNQFAEAFCILVSACGMSNLGCVILKMSG
jgi:hypothetical protein